MEFSRPVVVQYHGHLTLTLDFQGQILKKKSHLMNGMADWRGIKGMWVNRMLDPCCDFQCPRHPWPWPRIFMVKIWKGRISGMGGPIDMGQKGCELIGCYTHFVTINFDFGFPRSSFEKKSYLMNGMADWHGTKGMRVDRMWDPCCDFQCSPLPWPWPWIFKAKFKKKSYLGNGMADWHGTKGMWVDGMLYSLCDFKLWPDPWPWPWILKIKYWNCCNLGMGGSTHLEWKGCELDMMLNAQWD